MNGEWCYFKSYFSRQYCEDLLKIALTIPSNDAVIGINESSRTDNSNRRSQIRFINNGDWRFDNLFTDLWKTALRANQDFFNVHVTKLDYVQIAEYKDIYKGEYKDHQDVFWTNKDPLYHRKLSCIVQLSDPEEYEGGEFELIDTSSFPNAKEIKEQGTIIFFPSFFYHRAKPITKGTRYSLAAWFDGPKWR